MDARRGRAARLADERGVDTKADKDWPQLVDHAFSHYVEPGLIQPTIVHDYPIEISPFARTTDDDPTLTERFEYFAGGMELGNAFSEINDAEEQAARFEEQSEHVEGERGDPDYVEALSYGMPPTGGLGLGIDRLTMLLTGRETIRDVDAVPGASRNERCEAPSEAARARAGEPGAPAASRFADAPALERDHVGEDLVEGARRRPADRCADLLDRRLAVQHVLDRRARRPLRSGTNCELRLRLGQPEDARARDRGSRRAPRSRR